MLFNSLEFIVFFPLILLAYFLCPHRFRWALLLAASYYFYMCWKPEYILLIILSTLIDYYAGVQMSKEVSRPKRRKFLLLSLVTNLGLLFSFKYANFFNESVRSAFQSVNILYDVPTFHLLLPVGISFYTFQTLSYSIDVYRGERQAEKHFGIFALYVAFFPQLVAGPIERSCRLLPQFYQQHDFDMQRVSGGLQLMLWGFFKKLVIADRLALFVDAVYNHPGNYHGLPILMATYFFAFQIYCDFSGYSDIAIGASQVMGFSLMENFQRPYFSKSIGEFWKRWHISLSSWFRDYLYIPLGGNRLTKWRWYFNLFTVFLISGLWHGANWTFVVWGMIHGFYLIFSILTRRIRSTLSNALAIGEAPFIQKSAQVFLTFHLVVFSWIFFRANTLSDAFLLLHNLCDLPTIVRQILTIAPFEGIALDQYEILIALVSIGCMEGLHVVQRRWRIRRILSTTPLWLRWGLYYAVIFTIIIFGIFEKNEFIYFQF